MIKVTSLTNYYNGHVLDNSEFESLDSWIDECVESWSNSRDSRSVRV